MEVQCVKPSPRPIKLGSKQQGLQLVKRYLHIVKKHDYSIPSILTTSNMQALDSTHQRYVSQTIFSNQIIEVQLSNASPIES